MQCRSARPGPDSGALGKAARHARVPMIMEWGLSRSSRGRRVLLGPTPPRRGRGSPRSVSHRVVMREPLRASRWAVSSCGVMAPGRFAAARGEKEYRRRGRTARRHRGSVLAIAAGRSSSPLAALVAPQLMRTMGAIEPWSATGSVFTPALCGAPRVVFFPAFPDHAGFPVPAECGARRRALGLGKSAHSALRAVLHIIFARACPELGVTARVATSLGRGRRSST